MERKLEVALGVTGKIQENLVNCSLHIEKYDNCIRSHPAADDRGQSDNVSSWGITSCQQCDEDFTEGSKKRDLTYLIDDSFSKELPEGSYTSTIPTGKISYRIFRDKILADIQSRCPCKHNCVGQLLQSMEESNVIKKVQNIRGMYLSIVQGNKRTTKLIELIRNTRVLSKQQQKIVHNFEGVLVCRKKWMQILGISKSTYYRAYSYVKADVYTLEKIPRQSWRNYRGLDAIGFINLSLKFYGDYSPEIEKTILPPCITRKFLFDEYMRHPVEHVSESRFYNLFNLNYKKSVIFSSNNKINPCDVCVLASNQLQRLTNVKDKENLKRDLKEHLNRQRNERIAYYAHKNDALARPHSAMSLIIDGMDQAKTALPHFRGWTKPKLAIGALKTHITGVMVHGYQNKFYIDCNQYAHDTNLTITCIVNSLKHHISPDGTLPETLYIQCDNCGRENKNKYILGFLAYMCHVGLVKEVFLSFLMKGHTHEDIDQKFSRISSKLKKTNAFTMNELQKAVQNSFVTTCHVEVLGSVWDARGWISNSLNEIYNHSYPHQFWMFVDKPNHVSMKTRLWSTENWYPSVEEEPMELFILKDGIQCIPEGNPLLVEPSYEKVEEFRPIMEKMKVHFSFEQYRWWERFLSDPGKYLSKRTEWPLHIIRPIHKIINIPAEVNYDNIQTAVTPLVEVERNRPKVQVRNRKARQ